MMRSILALAALQLAVLAAPLQDAAQATDKYIVVLKPEHSLKSLGLTKRGSIFESVNPFHTYDFPTFHGFAALLTAGQVKELRSHDNVAYVEMDGILHTQDKLNSEKQTTQNNSTWGLARISHRQNGAHDYLYDSQAGSGSCAYIIDTGIDITHEEFEGRATFVKNFDTVDGTDDDLYGHGTHVAGTIGSMSYGVAKKTQLFAMKTCNQNGDCDLSAINKAIELTISDSKQRDCPNGVIINMSLGAPNAEWQSIKDAIKQAVDAGIFVAVAAGNDNNDASFYTPASSPGVCVAGASDKNDSVATFSNWGRPLSVYAPGVDVLSTSIGGKGSTKIMSGTSMASPHLAGLGAYLMGINGKTNPTDLCNKIKTMASKNMLKGLRPLSGTNNLLAFNGQT